MSAVAQIQCVFCKTCNLDYVDVGVGVALRCTSCGSMGPHGGNKNQARKLYLVAGEVARGDAEASEGLVKTMAAAIWNAVIDYQGGSELRYIPMRHSREKWNVDDDYVSLELYSDDAENFAKGVLQCLQEGRTQIDDEQIAEETELREEEAEA